MKIFQCSFLTLRFVLFVVFTISVALFCIIYYFCRENSIETAKLVSYDSTKYIKEIRTYYSKEIIEKIQGSKEIVISYDHYNKPNTIPIPATFVLDISDIVSGKNDSLSFRFYSEYPFTNRKGRVLDTFQLNAIQYLKSHPTETYSEKDTIAGRPVFRLAVADLMVNPGCVSCHNTHPNSTKKDWKLGEFRGVLETQYSLKNPLELAWELSLRSFLFVFLSISILTFFLFSLIRRAKKDFQKNVEFMAEFQASSKIQQSLIPKGDNSRLFSYEFSSLFQPAVECGGDWWHYYPLDNQRVLVLIGDVTGHGISSAIVTAVVKGYCDNIKNEKQIDLNSILKELSAVVRDCSSYESKLMSLFALILDSKTGTMKFANAGHPFPLFQSHNPKIKTHSLLVGGKLLGENCVVENKIDYVEKEMSFLEGDVIVLYSDGLIERAQGNKENYKTKNLSKILEKCYLKPVDVIRDTLVQETMTYYKNIPQSDDITLVVIKVVPAVDHERGCDE